MERLILFLRTEIFSGKRDLLKDRPKYSQTEFPNGKCALHLLVWLVPDLLAWITFDTIFREKVLKMEGAHPWGTFHSGFDTSHLTQEARVARGSRFVWLLRFFRAQQPPACIVNSVRRSFQNHIFVRASSPSRMVFPRNACGLHGRVHKWQPKAA